MATKTIEMDLEKLQLMTETRANAVQLHIDNGWKTDWEFVEEEVAWAVKALERERAGLERERALEPFREAGRTMKQFVETVTSIFNAFADGFENG